jgi:MFS family permease
MKRPLRRKDVDPALVALVSEGFFSRLSFGLISFALPLYAHESLDMSFTAIGVLLSLNLVVAIALKPVTGAIADKVGLKPTLTAAVVFRSLVAGLLALAAVPWHLFATRALHGVSIAARDPAVNSLLADHGGTKAVASAFAWYQTAKTLAGAGGKVAAGLLLTLTASNFSFVFAVAFVASAVPIVLVVRYVPRRERIRVDWERELVEETHAAPRERARLAPFVGLGFLVSGSAYMLTNLFPVFAVAYAGLTPAEAGLIYALSAVLVFAAPVFGWLSDNVSRKLVLSLRSAANVLSSVVYWVAPNFAGMAVGRGLDDLGKAAFRPGWGALMAHVSSLDRRRRARTMGYLSAGEDAGEVAGPIAAGLLWSVWGVPALLGARIAVAVAAELYTIAVMRSLGRLEADSAPASALAEATGSR